MISIIIPTYNEEKAIEKALAQFRSMTVSHEIIVTDDKSTDNTAEIARQYADLVLVPPAKHVSISANRNDGVRHSHGDMLVSIDADSRIMEPEAFFARALKHFDADPRLVALTGSLHVLPELETAGDRIVYAIFNAVHLVKNNFLHMGEAPGRFQMMRRSAFDEVGGFREDLITREDSDMFSRLSKIGRTLYDPELEVFHSGRRAHAVGWPRLLTIWMTETFWVAAFGKSRSKNWERWWEKGAKPKQ
jgi:glycosyltransferase involved in cell wall biosynthesis